MYIIERLREYNEPPFDYIAHEAAAEIERLREALLEIFDHECRNSDKSFIACTAREALWPKQKESE